jgi:hypothetical protein
MSSHWRLLQIKLGRRDLTLQENRLYTLCASITKCEVEDEMHMLLSCPPYCKLNNSYGLEPKGTNTERIISLLSSGNSKSIFQLAAFVFYAFELPTNSPVFYLLCYCSLYSCIGVVTLLCKYWIYGPEAYFLNKEFELELEHMACFHTSLFWVVSICVGGNDIAKLFPTHYSVSGRWKPTRVLQTFAINYYPQFDLEVALYIIKFLHFSMFDTYEQVTIFTIYIFWRNVFN